MTIRVMADYSQVMTEPSRQWNEVFKELEKTLVYLDSSLSYH